MKTSSERGVSLIIVALVLTALIFLSAFVVDFGVMWLGRTQAQAAADAGALAGAVARAYDEPASPGTITTTSATQAAAANLVFNEPGGSLVYTDSGACPPHAPAATWGPCVKVEVYRDGTNGSNPLPTYFAQAFGVGWQATRAMAIAQVRGANYSSCLKPWLIPDRFIDANNNRLWDPGDTYIPPDEDGTTTYAPENSLGVEVVLKPSNGGNIAPSNYFEVEDANLYEESIVGCHIAKAIGDTMNVLPGNRVGPTKQGTLDLIDLDPYATLDANFNIVGSCAPGCAPFSPRLVPIAVYDPREYANLGYPSGGNFNLTIVNILGFFVTAVDNSSQVTGVFLNRMGEIRGNGGAPTGPTFTKAIVLVQ